MRPDIRNYSDIGQQLRMAREAMKLDVSDAAHHLNIRAKYLVALEDGELSVMPGPVYVRGYLQNYAEFLHLDHAEILQAFDGVRTTKKEMHYFVPEPTSRNYQPGMVVVGVALGVVLLIYMYWYATHQDAISPPSHELVSPVPERLTNLPGMTEKMLPPERQTDAKKDRETLHEAVPVARNQPSSLLPPTEVKPATTLPLLQPEPAPSVAVPMPEQAAPRPETVGPLSAPNKSPSGVNEMYRRKIVTPSPAEPEHSTYQPVKALPWQERRMR